MKHWIELSEVKKTRIKIVGGIVGAFAGALLFLLVCFLGGMLATRNRELKDANCIPYYPVHHVTIPSYPTNPATPDAIDVTPAIYTVPLTPGKDHKWPY